NSRLARSPVVFLVNRTSNVRRGISAGAVCDVPDSSSIALLPRPSKMCSLREYCLNDVLPLSYLRPTSCRSLSSAVQHRYPVCQPRCPAEERQMSFFRKRYFLLMPSHRRRQPASSQHHENPPRPYPDFAPRHPAGSVGYEISTHGRAELRRTAPHCRLALRDPLAPDRNRYALQLLLSCRAQSVSLSSE